MYEDASLITITKYILIIHQALQEVPEIECHKKILDVISRHLSHLKLEEDVDLLPDVLSSDAASRRHQPLLLDELGHLALQAGVTPSHPGPQGTASQSVALLATRLV